jgi:hypothetical protein
VLQVKPSAKETEMKTILLSAVALGALTGAAFAEPVKMDLGQLNQVAAGVEIDPTATTQMAPPDDMPVTGLDGFEKGKGHDGKYDCGCYPNFSLAAGENVSNVFQKDSGAAVTIGTGRGAATFFAASEAAANGVSWGLAF